MSAFETIAERYGEPHILAGPDAPQWRFAALGIGHGLMVSGKGPNVAAARTSCLGEAAEVLSALRRPTDNCFETFSLSTGEWSQIDAAFATISSLDDPEDAGTEGLGSGNTVEEAQLSAVLERIERHAIAEWWQDAALVSRIEPCWIKSQKVAEIEAAARSGAKTRRHTEFLLLRAHGPVHVVAAVSHAPNATWPVIGYAAHSNVAEACRKALSELFQMELSLTLARIAEIRGEPSKNEAVLRRSRLLRTEKAHLVTGELLTPPEPARFDIEVLSERHDTEVFLINLTRTDIAAPVWRAYAPGLSSARKLKFSENGGPV